MKLDKNILRFITDTGFSSNTSYEGNRLLNKDGTIKIKRTGLRISERFSFFHWLITMNWLSFFTILLIGYILINTVFALMYLSFGIDGLSGSHPSNFTSQFLTAFYFSAQTLTTVGYGAISPIQTPHNIIATFESFVGLLSFAMNTGLLYGRFSKPKAQMLFSKFALISPYKNTGKGLMMRIVNKKDSQLINVNANLIFSWADEKTNQRKFANLDLEIKHINILASSWTIVHPITENSPLQKWSKKQFENRNVEVLLQVDAYDEAYSQQVHTRTSYKFPEIIWDAKFKSILGHNQHGEATLHLNQFHDYESLSNN